MERDPGNHEAELALDPFIDSFNDGVVSLHFVFGGNSHVVGRVHCHFILDPGGVWFVARLHSFPLPSNRLEGGLDPLSCCVSVVGWGLVLWGVGVVIAW